MKKIESKEPINANAEYIRLQKGGQNILVDMHDIDDIVYVQDIQVVKKTSNNICDCYDQNNIEIKKLYSVMFDDHTFWQIPIDDKEIKIFEKFKNKLDRQK